MDASTFFEAADSLETPPEILEAEEAYQGGVGDLGDSSAAVYVQGLASYRAYRAGLAHLAQEHLGDSFTVWRALTEDATEEWEAGSDLGPISVTLDPKIARAWSRLAMNRDQTFRVAEFEVSPDMIVMRGKPEEWELVIDGNRVSYGELRFVDESANDWVARLLG